MGAVPPGVSPPEPAHLTKFSDGQTTNKFRPYFVVIGAESRHNLHVKIRTGSAASIDGTPCSSSLQSSQDLQYYLVIIALVQPTDDSSSIIWVKEPIRTDVAPEQAVQECLTCRIIGTGALAGVGIYALQASRPHAPGSIVGKRIMAGLGVGFLIASAFRWSK
ncbi:hypothetical protein BDW22DRAFT_1342905 [Trametopsis cervina]|nr:hypothetical protein BDW22DRAFT_1342905 [Trametopsis cervina]